MGNRDFLLFLAQGSRDEVEHRFYQAHCNGHWEKRLPGFSKLEGCRLSSDYHKEGDLLAHTAKVFAAASQIQGFSQSNRVVLLLAALLHDFAKPETREVLENGAVIFPEHEIRAVERCPQLAEAFSLTREELEERCVGGWVGVVLNVSNCY